MYRSTHTSTASVCLLLSRMQGGLDRLAEAAGTVNELSQQAEAQRTLLAAKQGEADAALGNIQVRQRRIDVPRRITPVYLVH